MSVAGRASVSEELAELGRPTIEHGERKRTALLYVQRLTKVYELRRGFFRAPELAYALRGVSFYVRRRETLGIVGESGSGKSTLARCILRLIEPTVGRIVFDGRDVTALRSGELRALRRRMQIVFQDPYASLDPNMTVQEIVREGIDVYALAATRKEGNSMVAALLVQVGLEPTLAERYPHELSGGERQRVAIARAIALKPELLVLDEPTSALDVSVGAQILNLLQELQEKLGIALLFISHDLRTVQYFSHRMGVMYAGKLVELGPTDAVQKRRYHPYTRALFAAMTPSREAPAIRLPVLRETPAESDEHARGCVFFARCPNAEPGRCDIEEPRLSELFPASHHRVACFHPQLD
ncbi:MAG: ABC transporter ATP-binding protein [Myxococcales bacterium]|nr:ABC transporter ATP-binding protein [Myxococcales bacterium]